MNYNNNNLWDLFLQPVTIFNWKNILEQWDNSLVMPHKIQVVVDNLRAASDSDSIHEIPLRHFLDYLNYEEEAIIWFLYEVITLRWSWGETRLDFVKEILRNHRDCFDLEKTFPDFPGSPRQSQTVREFLVAFLNSDEQNYVQIPEYISNKNQSKSQTYNTLSEAFEAIRKSSSVKVEAQPQPQQQPTFDWSAVQKAFEEAEIDNQEELIQLQKQNRKLNKQNKKLEKQKNRLIEENELLAEAIENIQSLNEANENIQEQSKDDENNIVEEEMPIKYAPFTIQFNRKSGEDDRVMIRKVDDDLYTIVFTDSSANICHKVKNVTREHVISHISSSLRLMRYDIDPYENIQIFIPAGPTVLLHPRTTIQIRETLYDCLETTMDNWPVSF